jgi:hypothetical protein
MLMLMLGRCPTDGSLLLLAPGHQQAEAYGQYVTTLAYLTGCPELQPQRDALASDLETQQAVVAVLLDHALPRFTAALERAGCGNSSSSWDDDEDAKEHEGGERQQQRAAQLETECVCCTSLSLLSTIISGRFLDRALAVRLHGPAAR